MAAVTICSDLGAQETKVSLFPLFLHLFVMKRWDWMPASASSSLVFRMMYSEHKLNKQGDNIQPDVLLSQFGSSLLFNVQF